MEIRFIHISFLLITDAKQGKDIAEKKEKNLIQINLVKIQKTFPNRLLSRPLKPKQHPFPPYCIFLVWKHCFCCNSWGNRTNLRRDYWRSQMANVRKNWSYFPTLPIPRKRWKTRVLELEKKSVINQDENSLHATRCYI